MSSAVRFSRGSRRPVALLMSALLVALGLTVLSGGMRAASAAPAVPSGFQDTPVLTGLSKPTTAAFATDGRIFVAEKSGLIKVFHGLADRNPTIFADLRTRVYNFWDRGLLGLVLDPQFSSGRPYVYVLYTHDAAIGGTAPRWGVAGASSDGCPTPPGAMALGCVASGHLSKLTANGDVMAGNEQVLVEGWCQQFPSHSMGTVAFGADGKLYASAGDGASFVYQDHGQTGNNVCGDPAGEGGALRAQSLRNGGHPTVLNGGIIRVDPDTGTGSATNPRAASPDRNARRLVAEGLRNPFRFIIRPGTNEVWAGDVGWNTWEEINRVVNPTASVTNFGWPCWEGRAPQAAYSVEPMCQSLPASAVTAPYFTYNHADHVAAGDNCPTGSSSISGMAFHTGGNYPASYNGALFFADYSRNCIWVMPKGGNGLPDPAKVRSFVTGAAGPVSLMTGPGGDLYYTDLNGGALHRITYTAGNNPPVASVRASALNGKTPLSVSFDAGGSSDPDPGDRLTYSWDLNGDGIYGDATGITARTTFTSPGNHSVTVKVTDSKGASSTATVNIAVGPGAPTATIDTPLTSTSWAAGDPITFHGSAIDPTDGVLPASALSWSAVIEHCPSNCHTHPLQDFPAVDHGSFTAPDHEYPSYLTLSLTATDSLGLKTVKTVRLDPATVALTFTSQPAGLKIAIGGLTGTTPFTRTVIANSTNSITALAPQSLGGRAYAFSSWSDGGTQGHNVVAGPTGSAPQTFTANYSDTGPGAPTDPIVTRHEALGGDQGLLGAPVGGEYADAGGTAQNYTAGRIYYSAATGAHEVHGAILAHYLQLGGPTGLLGLPTSDETNTAGPGGRYNNFSNGAITWTPAVGAHETHGAIRARWAALGYELSRLGFPTTDEYPTPGGRRSDFQHGYITWLVQAGTIVTYR